MSALHFLSVVACLAAASAPAGPDWVSGAQIPVGTKDGFGPLAPHAIMSVPLGYARFEGETQPGVFVATTKYGTEPGIWFYRAVAHESDTLAFEKVRPAGHPFENPYPPAGCVAQRRDGAVVAFWLAGGALVHTVLDTDSWRFHETTRLQLEGLPHGPNSVGAVERADGSWRIYLGVGDGTRYIHWEGSTRNPAYQPYTGAGIWHGGHPYSALYVLTVSADGGAQSEPPVRASHRDRDVRMGLNQIAVIATGRADEEVVTGSCFGGLHYFATSGPDGDWAPRRLAAGEDGIALRHPTIYPRPMAYPDARGDAIDLLVGGEGGIYHYAFTGKFTESDQPIYEEPVFALEAGAKLYGGTLPVPSVVDWDGDGDLDMVAGNSEGLVLFFENAGDNDAPMFLPGVPLWAGDEMIHVQPGYRLDIQGPGEARWGYTCPTVVDWDGDGLLDIVMSDSTARHHVYLNVGSAAAPRLAPARPLYYEGLDMHGTWRVQPAAGQLGDRMAYIALDEDDQFHLYWQVDAYNLLDGGKLRLENGDPIYANFLHAGGTGRLKLSLVDWDRDGAKDLLVGTPRHGSVPHPETGLPQRLGLPGSAVLLLRNTGTDATPVFAFPKLMAFRGKPIFLGQHACGPAAAPFRGMDDADLIVAEEEGRFRYYRREDLSLMDAAEYVKPETD